MSISRIILASASPRRLELLMQIGVDAEVHPAHIDESPFDDEAADLYVLRMAREKAAAVATHFSADAIIIAADTSVIIDGQILGKPADERSFIQMFRALSGHTHEVLSAVCLQHGNHYEQRLNRNRVSFRTISETEMTAYWKTCKPADKAGGYGIQDKAALFIDKIEGSYSGIMGLPLYETGQLLTATGYELLPETKP